MTVFGSNPALKLLSTMKPTHQEPYQILSRRWLTCSEPKDRGQVFRVMQWNVLAQGLTASNPKKNFCQTQTRHLAWETRRYLLLMEVLSYRPDVLILCEIDRYDFFETKLREFGYKGKFIERPFSPCVEVPGEGQPDGCAIFYHTERFMLADLNHRQLLNQMKHSTGSLAMALKLECVEDDAPLVVIASHLKGGPKTEQTRFEACQDLVVFMKEHTSPGDMVVMGVDVCEEPGQIGYDTLASELRDSYTFALEGRSPGFTTWRVRPVGEEKYTNDCILYSDQQLRVLQALDVPAEKLIGGAKLPNNYCGSDHVPLVTDFQRVLSQ